MAHTVPSKLGPYEILGPLGSGGMGTVYKARDTRLDRTVAIKIPGDGFSDRTKREARAVAALQHPNICGLFDVGTLPDGRDFLVIEYIEGETLAERLKRGPMPLDQALPLAMQVADALEAAHRNGIVHRDLKPGNIMLTKSGAKVLDFGLARFDGAVAAQAATVTAVTAPGTLLGTVQYMAPEQLEGKDADKRTDLFAFGAVLYEMLAGRPAFSGKTQASLIASIMASEPPRFEAPELPPPVGDVIRTCLAKDPDERWQSAHDVKLALATVSKASHPHPAARSRERFAWIAGMLLLVAVATMAALYFRARPQPAPAIRSSIMPPPGWYFERNGFALSPDGTRLAFAAVGPNGLRRLWVRVLAASSAQQFNETDNALFPFWSPDSTRVGFFAAGKLKTLDVNTGTVHVLADAPTGRCGGAWGRDGTIVFAPATGGVLFRVAESGGTPVPVTKLREGSGQSHRWPVFLPDGRRFLFFTDWSGPRDQPGNALYAGFVDGSPSRLLSTEVTGNVAMVGDYLLYGRDRSLRAHGFDADRLQMAGGGVSLVEQELEQHPGFSHAAFSVSADGVLVFQSLVDSTSHLTWFDSSGRELGRVPQTGYMQPRLSPDDRFVVADFEDVSNGKSFIRVYDFARGGSTFISDRGTEEGLAWSRDGTKLTYVSLESNASSVYEVPADGSTAARLLLRGGVMRHLDWSPDGHLLFTDFSTGGPKLKVYSAATERVVPFGPDAGAEGRFSPDGRWVAFVSFGGVIAQPFPGPGGRIRISTSGGAQPVWSRDGRQLFYISADRKLMVVDFDGVKKSASTPRVLFQTRIVAPNFFNTQYDVARDGRILMNSVPENYSSPLTLVTGWTSRLRP